MNSPAREAFIRAQTAIGTAPLVPEVRLHLATDATALWHATETSLQRDQLPPPYWAFAWPGGQALARFILDHGDLVRGRRVLDFGAGCGIVAIAAALAGAAAAVAVEIDPFALAAIGINADLNGVAIDLCSRNVLEEPETKIGEVETILVGDMCYEQPLASRLMDWLHGRRAGGAAAFLADPGRAYLPKSGMVPLATYAVPTSLELEDRTIRNTTVWRLA